MTMNDEKDQVGSVSISVPVEWLDLSSDNIEKAEPVDMGALLKANVTEHTERQLIRGKVVAITPTDVLVDVGLKSEGMVPREEFTDGRGNVTVQVGEEVEVFLERMEDINGHVVLSKSKAIKMKAWEEVEHAFRDDRPIKGIILDRIKGGLAVDVGVRAFLPGSLVDLQPVRNLRALKGQEVELKVIKVNRKRGNIVLSRKAFLEEKMSAQKGRIQDAIQQGKLIKGTVKNLTNFGAFIDLGGIDGLLHVTDMSWRRINHPSEMFQVGDEVEVMVLNFDQETGKLQLGFKQKEPSPWMNVLDKFPIGTKVRGKVISLQNYGAFVELEPGIEGMIHISEMSWTKKYKHPSAVLDVSDMVEVVILDIDKESQRISLGLKQAEPNPWDIITETYRVNDEVKGKVRNITDFGVFVEILDGVDGLVHISDLSWKRVNHPSEVVKKGDEVDAVITNIDPVNQRLSLSMKALQPDIWDEFFKNHYVGDMVEGTVTKLVDFGAFVDLGDGVEGLVHISELADKHISACSEVVEVGHPYTFKVIRLEPNDKRIGLSLKEASRRERQRTERGEEREPQQYGQSQQESGGASIGEMLGLKSFATPPEITPAETPHPEVPEPVISQPEVAAPEVSPLEVPEPGASQPDVPAPDGEEGGKA
jgi:small subunit ribosomal protein S1